MPIEAMLPPMDITAEELADRLLALPPNPREKKRKPAEDAPSGGRSEPLPMVAKGH